MRINKLLGAAGVLALSLAAAPAMAQDGAVEFLDRSEGLLRLLFSGYVREGKHYALLAVGCTGGKHRSVAMVEQLAGRLAGSVGVDVSVVHRDLGRE